MKRRTVDLLVPLVYVLAVVVAVFIGEEGGIGGVATIGAILVAAYYLTLRQNLKA
jgi:hypothetical protein